jgi:outer membrane protein assembly factor BamB
MPDWRLVARTASAGEPAAVPSSVSKVAWSTEVDGEIKEVAAGGMGAVVMFADGIAGVDGTTGEIRWSRRRAGAQAKGIDVSPDGRTVLLQMSPADRFPIRREVLDAVTGELRFSEDSANDRKSVNGFYAPMTNASYIGAAEDRSVFRGYSLVDGRKLWDFPMPAGCYAVGGNSDQLATADAMLLPLSCNKDELRYVAVDGATGQPRWQHTVKFPKGFSKANLSIFESPDHRLVRMWLEGAADPYIVLDTETGTVVSKTRDLTLRDYGLGFAGEPKNQTLVDARSGRVIVRGDAAAFGCVRDAASLLSGGALCLDTNVKPLANVMTTGIIEFATTRFGEDKVTPLSVPLGGPFEEPEGASDAFVARPGPGAVFMYSEFPPVDGARHRLVGLN